MLETAIAEGVTPAVRERVASHLRHLAESGADAMLVTCSSIGEAAEEAVADSLPIPVIRVDAAMAAPGRTPRRASRDAARIAVLATNTATLGPTTRLIEREAAAQGVAAVVTASVVEGAAAARAAGDQATHDRLIAEAVREAAAPADGDEPPPCSSSRRHRWPGPPSRPASPSPCSPPRPAASPAWRRP